MKTKFRLIIKSIIFILIPVTSYKLMYYYFGEQKSQQYMTLKDIHKKVRHLAIIPDGNRRWAKKRNLQPSDGHKYGFLTTAPTLIEEIWKIQIHTVTLWGFSTENWNRSQNEINTLMSIYDLFIDLIIPVAEKYEAKIVHLGRKDRIPQFLVNKLNCAISKTAHFSKHVFNFALDYSGQDEIIRGCKKLLQLKLTPDKVTQKTLENFLDTGNQPYPIPDLIIRTSGEQRLSGFMSWQSAYSEFYFVEKHFPSFDKKALKSALRDFSFRQRRFGK